MWVHARTLTRVLTHRWPTENAPRCYLESFVMFVINYALCSFVAYRGRERERDGGIATARQREHRESAERWGGGGAVVYGCHLCLVLKANKWSVTKLWQRWGGVFLRRVVTCARYLKKWVVNPGSFTQRRDSTIKSNLLEETKTWNKGKKNCKELKKNLVKTTGCAVFTIVSVITI